MPRGPARTKKVASTKRKVARIGSCILRTCQRAPSQGAKHAGTGNLPRSFRHRAFLRSTLNDALPARNVNVRLGLCPPCGDRLQPRRAWSRPLGALGYPAHGLRRRSRRGRGPCARRADCPPNRSLRALGARCSYRRDPRPRRSACRPVRRDHLRTDELPRRAASRCLRRRCAGAEPRFRCRLRSRARPSAT